ncbi:MAG: hypothetical protein ACI9XO_002348 [Paraglaciecola sp.]|jgi:hypothetical protein
MTKASRTIKKVYLTFESTTVILNSSQKFNHKKTDNSWTNLSTNIPILTNERTGCRNDCRSHCT